MWEHSWNILIAIIISTVIIAYIGMELGSVSGTCKRLFCENETSKWIISIGTLLLGAWVIILNWLMFYQNFIIRKKYSSFVPLVGGIFMLIGLYNIPVQSVSKWYWLPLFIDFGSIPLLAWTLVSFIHLKVKSQSKGK